MRKSAARALTAAVLAAGAAGCGEIYSGTSLEAWRKAPPLPLRNSDPLPPARIEVAGTGKVVEDGAVVRVELEILEPSSFHDGAKREKKTAWLWIAREIRPRTDFGSSESRRLLIGQKVGTVLTVDVKSRVPGKRPEPFVSVFLFTEPFAESVRNAVIVYDSVYRMRVVEACAAERFEATGTYRRYGFHGSCKGDFLPSSCDAGFVQSARLVADKVTARCESGERSFFDVSGDPTSRNSPQGFASARDALLADLRKSASK